MSGERGVTRPGRRAVLRAGVLAAAAAGIGWVSWRPGATRFAGTPVVRMPAPKLALADDVGGRFELARQRGRVVLVYFGYTTCPDVCPTTLAAIADATARLGAGAALVRTVFVTLDPTRDTPGVLRAYLANFVPAGGAAPIGLTDSAPRIAAAARDWGVTWKYSGGGRFIDHSSVVNAVAPDGTLRLRYGFSQLDDSAAFAGDLTALLRDV